MNTDMATENDVATWCCIALTPEQKEFGFKDIIRAEMEEIWISQGAQEGFSIWSEEQDENLNIYFSPAAALSAKILIYRFNGKPCPPPEYKELTFILGHVFNDDAR